MNDVVAETLRKLVAQYGVELCSNRQRVGGLLQDLCGEHRREVNVLVSAVREGVAEELLRVSGRQVDPLLFHRLARRLYDNMGMAEEFADWAVSSWAAALGKAVSNTSMPKRGDATPIRGDAAKAEPRAGEERVNLIDGAAMVYIPAGEFVMGSKVIPFLRLLSGRANEAPQRRVTLDGYWIYKYPVTVAQYRKLYTATGRHLPPVPGWGWQDDHPIVNVTWEDALAYCQWAGVRLPTEAEWEKAARGIDGREYPWGNEWESKKCAIELKDMVAVGSYPEGASPYGVQDMAGLVWEWCADWYDSNYYQSAPGRNPTGPGSGQSRVVRGGSWGDRGAFGFRCAYRHRFKPEVRHDHLGFRCVQSR